MYLVIILKLWSQLTGFCFVWQFFSSFEAHAVVGLRYDECYIFAQRCTETLPAMFILISYCSNHFYVSQTKRRSLTSFWTDLPHCIVSCGLKCNCTTGFQSILSPKLYSILPSCCKLQECDHWRSHISSSGQYCNFPILIA